MIEKNETIAEISFAVVFLNDRNPVAHRLLDSLRRRPKSWWHWKDIAQERGNARTRERTDMSLEFWPELSSLQAYLLAGTILGLLLAAKCLAQLVFPKYHPPKWTEASALAGALVLAFILTLDAWNEAAILGDVGVAGPSLIALGLSVIFCAAHASIPLLLRHSPRLVVRQAVFCLMIVLTLGTSVWSSHRFSVRKLRLELEKLDYVAAPGNREALPDSVAVTDRGRAVKLYRWVPDGEPSSLLDSQSNCHGWVFAGGQHLIVGNDVQRILDDNGYQCCSSPQSGDLIVYRNAIGEIIHTGVVIERLIPISPLVESKWGLGARFVHAPKDQPYGSNYSYYRSARLGHKLPIRSARPPMAMASL